jgi:hypothetical protein
MSFEDLLQEHIKALNENTKALMAYTKALRKEEKIVEVEHTKGSACKFCGITYKTMQTFLENGFITACRKRKGTREYFMEKDLVNLCESKKLFDGDYGNLRNNPRSMYFGGLTI